MTNTDIDWADIVWNPVRGCSRKSAGCYNCYAEKIAGRFSGEGQAFHGFAIITPRGARWTGKVELQSHKMTEPLQRRNWATRFLAEHGRKPRCFVNSTSDLFHEALLDVDIQNVLTIIKAVPEIDFLVLTKRAERLPSIPSDWLSPNLWLGVSVEDQKTADERIPNLMKAPASVRFVSYEPALGPVNFQTWMKGHCEHCGWPCWRQGYHDGDSSIVVCGREVGNGSQVPGLDWIICGDESGAGSRPSAFGDWYRPVLAAAKRPRTAVFIKQLCEQGKRIPFEKWPTDLQVRQFPATR